MDPGDEVIIPTPFWTTYPEAIRLAGGVPVEVFAGPEQGYLVTVEQLEAAVTDRTKILLFVSPVQPHRRCLQPGAGCGDRQVGRVQGPLGCH